MILQLTKGNKIDLSTLAERAKKHTETTRFLSSDKFEEKTLKYILLRIEKMASGAGGQNYFPKRFPISKSEYVNNQKGHDINPGTGEVLNVKKAFLNCAKTLKTLGFKTSIVIKLNERKSEFSCTKYIITLSVLGVEA